MWNDFIATVGPPFIGLLGVIATAVIAWGMTYVKANWLNGVAQDAFANAAGGIVNQIGEDLLKRTLKPADPEVREAVAKVKARIPDTVKALGLSPDAVAERVIDHVGKLQAPAIGAMIQSMLPPMMHTGANVSGGSPPPNFDRPGR